jgi:integrase
MRALVRLMRWSGLAVRDAVGLRRDQILRDNVRGLYRIVTNRQKTGTHVSVPIPDDVALEVLAAPVDCAPEYLFLRGTADVELSVKRWQTDFRNVFEAAGLLNTGFMISHRLRDTFAVDLLEKGVPLEEVSKLLGHESIKTTEKHYSKWMKGRQDRLDSLVTGTWATPAKRKARAR